jgi:GNAT superfamily N-acetyltransferase
MTQAVIRRAGPADAEILADLGARTFAATFGHLYPPEDLAAFLRRAYDVGATSELLADPAIAAWLVEADGEAVGHALAGPCGLPHPQVTAACGELKRLYLLPPWQGGGRGSRLLATALAWLEANRAGALWIGVWSQNLGAQRLYGRMGFEKVGEYLFEVGATRDREFILRRG